LTGENCENCGDIDIDVVGDEGENDVRRRECVDLEGVEPDSVDVEGRKVSLFILPSATVSFTAALLGLDSMVDIDRAGGRASA
jgi:hypothetical protein